ncbi:AAA family ATPase [Spirosoma jeollabukense]
MINKLNIENFRSISNVNLDLGKFTLLTGANNSGKSSFIYALLSLKNILSNPNQSIDNFFTFPFISLGGFTQTVFKKRDTSNISLGITYSDESYPNLNNTFTASIGKQESFFQLIGDFYPKLKLNISFPFAGSQVVNETVNYDDGGELAINWYGISGNVVVNKPSSSANEHVVNIQKQLVSHLSALSSVDGVSTRRNFTKPFFGAVPLQPQVWTEDEIATLLSTDRDLEGRVAHYLEKIVDRTFSVRVTPGTSNFYLQTRDRDTAFVSDLVNEGLGTNQLVSLLAKVLNKNSRLICIDEPEIHLHPTIINKLVDTLVNIADVEEKQFIISTHSEHFINALLRNVVEKKISSEDLKSYYLTKDQKGVTQIEIQAINDKGQIQGGLKNFYEAELENLKDLFSLPD